MINWRAQIYNLGKSLIPHFLRGGFPQLGWSTTAGLIWVTQQFQQWGTTGTGRHKEWIDALLSPIDYLNNKMAIYANDVYYRISITGQVIYLEHYLNDLHDPVGRGIYISDDALIFPPFLYRKRPLTKDTLYLYPDSNPITLYNQVDYFDQSAFIINVPSSIPLNSDLENKIRAAVNVYRQAGVAYTIVNY